MWNLNKTKTKNNFIATENRLVIARSGEGRLGEMSELNFFSLNKRIF